MSGRRRKISFGTIAMLLIACVTVTAALGVMQTIRRDEGDLAMDAEKLLDSVTSLMEMSQRHINDDAVIATSIEVSVTKAPQPQNEAPAQTPVGTVNASVSSETPPPQQQEQRHSVTMTFGGTVSLQSAVMSGAYDKENKLYRYDELLSGISSAVHADLNFVIFESLLTSGSISDKDLMTHPDAVQALTKAGFDTAVLCHENALAGGESIVHETLRTLSENGVTAVGLYLPENARRYNMLQVNGMHIAVLSYTDSLSAASKRAVENSDTRNNMIHLFDPAAVQSDISSAKAQGAQAVLVFMHWGAKDAAEPTSAQRKTAQLLCNAGADLLIGYNSNQVQPVELLSSVTDLTHNMLTAWSMGTLLSEDRSSRAVVSGMLLHVQFTCNTQHTSINFDRIEYTPTYCWRQEERGIYPYRVVRSDQSVPEGMIQKQREILARSLVLIQTTMKKGIAVQR